MCCSVRSCRAHWAASWRASAWQAGLYGLIMDGIVAGVGAVLGFVPQMLVLFFLLSILEDIGYMSRVAFIMDRIFRKFGLSGKSFILCWWAPAAACRASWLPVPSRTSVTAA